MVMVIQLGKEGKEGGGGKAAGSKLASVPGSRGGERRESIARTRRR